VATLGGSQVGGQMGRMLFLYGTSRTRTERGCTGTRLETEGGGRVVRREDPEFQLKRNGEELSWNAKLVSIGQATARQPCAH